MTTTAFLWQQIYRHKGAVGSLNWSPCGRFICCTSWGGDVAILDIAGKNHAKEQFANPPDLRSSLPFADWDHQRQTALFILTPERYRLVEVDGKEIESRPGHWANILRARPNHGGYVYSLTEESHTIVSIVNEAGNQIFTTSEEQWDIRAIEWSPNGSRLAIASRGWISIFDPWFRSHDLGMRGSPRAIAWLSERILAVGCHDTLIRIFTWKTGEDVGVGPTSIEILDAHESPITSLSYSAAGNSLVSVDDSGQIYLWQRGEGSFRIVMADKFETGELGSELIALLNPLEHKLAISSGRTLYIAQFNPAPQATENTAILDTSANAIEQLIVKAELQQFLVHSDSISDSWDIWKNDNFPDQISVSLEGKRIAKINRPLVQEISIALRTIYNNLQVAAKVEFERLAHEPCDGSSTSHLKFRAGLMVLLKKEIMADRPQYRSLAIAAFIGIAHLGLNEALAATGPESDINEILPKFDELSRLRVYALQQIIEQRCHELATRPFANAIGDFFKLKDVVEACLQDVSRIVKHTLAHGGGDMQSDNLYTIIFKGGGAKGLAHVGALHEIQRYYTCNHFVGTSAGAMIAIFLGAGFSSKDLEEQLMKADFHEMIREPIWRIFFNLVVHGGMYQGHRLTNWIDDLLAKKLCMSTQVKLKNLVPRRITIYACRRDKQAVVYDSLDPSTQYKPASHVARCSMALPLIFTPYRYTQLSHVPRASTVMRWRHPSRAAILARSS